MLYRNPKIFIKKSNIHGYGVFANQDIKSGELLEECPYFEVSHSLEKLKLLSTSEASSYLFRYPSSRDGKLEHYAFVFGCGSLFNSAKNLDEKSAEWETACNLFIFRAKH